MSGWGGRVFFFFFSEMFFCRSGLKIKKTAGQPSPKTNAACLEGVVPLLSLSLSQLQYPLFSPVSRLAVKGGDLVILSGRDDGPRQGLEARGARGSARRSNERGGRGRIAGQRRRWKPPRRRPGALDTLRARSDRGAMYQRCRHGGDG